MWSSCPHLAHLCDSCSAGFLWILLLFSEVFQLGMAISADKAERAGLMPSLLRANRRPVLAQQSGGFGARLCIQLWNKLPLGGGRAAARTHCGVK